MQHTVDDLTFRITRKSRLKHLYIYVRSEGVEVRAPLVMTQEHIYNFVHQKRDWIKKQQSKIHSTPKPRDLDPQELAQLRQKAQDMIEPLVQKWSKIMGVRPQNVGYRYNKSRWGSCSAKDRLNFNTKLAMMHHDFVEYVVVHELAHIRHKNHSKAFWDEVERFLPDFRERKKLINFQK